MKRNALWLMAVGMAAILLGASALEAMAATKIKWGATSVRSGLYANTVALGAAVNKAIPTTSR